MDLLGIFKWLKKEVLTTPIDCKSCMHYGCVNSQDKLNPDKTVTKGKLEYEFCNKGNFYLDEYKPCSFHEVGKRSAVIMPPPIGMRKDTNQKNLNYKERMEL